MELVENPEGKIPHRRLRRTWKDNIKRYRIEIVCENVDWIHVAQVGSSSGLL
jgi:hypothetical protein